MSARPSHSRRITLLAALAGGALLGGCSLFATPSPSPSPSATPTSAPATPSVTLPPTETPAPTMSACDAASLSAAITRWDAGAGHRFASVEMTNVGSSACQILALSQPQLLDGSGTVLIDGAPPGLSEVLTMAPGDTVKTTVDVANYCGPEPTPPVTVAFILAVSGGRVVAAPQSPTDVSGVPPCLGPTLPPEIQMQPWSP